MMATTDHASSASKRFWMVSIVESWLKSGRVLPRSRVKIGEAEGVVAASPRFLACVFLLLLECQPEESPRGGLFDGQMIPS